MASRYTIRNPNNVKFFNPNITSTRDIQENFRILSKTYKRSNTQATRDAASTNPEDIVVYTDGSCNKNGEANTRARLGVWFGPDDPRNTAAPIGRNIQQSNNTAELLAIHKALTLVPNQCRLHIKTDSRWAINILCENIENSTDANFAYTSHANLIKPIVNTIRPTAATTSFQWIKH